MFELLRTFGDMFEKFGGHAQAAGLTIRRENIEPFKHAVNEHIAANIPSALFVPGIEYDFDAKLGEITMDAVRDIARIAPFGVGNPAPVLRVRDVALERVAAIGTDGAHLRANVVHEGKSLPAVGFSFGTRSAELSVMKRADILFVPSINEWRGQSSIQLILKECKALPIENTAGYVTSLKGEFFSAFFANRGYSGARLPRVTHAQAREYLNEDIQGTLLLAFTPDGAAAALRELDAERFDLRIGGVADNMSYNALVLAPRLACMDLRGYQRVFVLDSKANIDAFIGQIQIGRAEMIKCYNALKSICGAYDSRARFYERLKSSIRGERWKIDFALTVFEELGFIEIKETTGFELRLLASEKRELGESAAFTYMHNAKLWYNDIIA